MVKNLIAQNRRARYDYEILEKFEAGIVLEGTEVKSLRLHSVSLKESHVMDQENELFLVNVNIPHYQFAGKIQHDQKRSRKLLLRKREINKILGNMKRKGFTVIPLQMYFNNRGLVKVEIALVQGKKQFDKRETIKKREWQRKKQRILKLK